MSMSPAPFPLPFLLPSQRPVTPLFPQKNGPPRLQAHALQLQEEKRATEEKLALAKKAVTTITGEMMHVAESANQLEAALGVASAAKDEAVETAETERRARLRAEDRLRVAEDALARLDRALRTSGQKMDVGIEVCISGRACQRRMCRRLCCVCTCLRWFASSGARVRVCACACACVCLPLMDVGV